MTTKAKFTETQTVILKAAVSCPDGNIEPLPATLRGGARTRVIEALTARGLVVALQGSHLLTDAGYAAVGKRRPVPKGVQKADILDTLQKLDTMLDSFFGSLAADASVLMPVIRPCHTKRRLAGANQRLFVLYLPGAELTLHASVYDCDVGERQMLLEALARLHLLILDRGYPAAWQVASVCSACCHAGSWRWVASPQSLARRFRCWVPIRTGAFRAEIERGQSII